MKFNRADFKYLRWSIVALVLATLIGAATAVAGYLYQQQARKAQGIAQTQRSDAQGKLATAAQEEVELREKIARFQELQVNGFIGKESRLDWVEQIARIANSHKLAEFGYEFAPQRPVDTLLIPSGPVAGGYSFMASRQRISLKMLHEGDVIGLLNDFRTNIHALILVRSCAIERLAQGPGTRALGPQLGAECELEWITAQPGK